MEIHRHGSEIIINGNIKNNADKIDETPNGVKIWFGSYSKEKGLSNEDEIYYI